MNYRTATVLAREVHASDITKVIDINLADPVSQFLIIHEEYNSASGSPTAHPARCITKIELVDGSDVLYSLSGVEAQAVDWYHRKIDPAAPVFYVPTLYNQQLFILNFGRRLWDPLLAFDPKQFKNPQLKITIDVNAGGLVPTTGYLTVLAKIFDQKLITPVGFLMHKEIKDYALSASGHEYTDLPVDFPYRKLLTRIQKYGTGPDYAFANVKLSEDNDRRIPLDLTISQILNGIVSEQRPIHESYVCEGWATSTAAYCIMNYWPLFAATIWEATALAVELSVLEGDGGRFYIDHEGGAGNTQVLGRGWVPHGALEFAFGDQDDPEDWYDPTGIGSLRLDVQASSAMTSSESCQVFAQQLRKY